MKNLYTLFLLIACTLSVQAQYTSFFNDDFHDNKNNWFVGKLKKSSVEFDSGGYSFYNDEGKSPIISLIDLPFDEKKNYRITSYVIEKYIPTYSEGRYGVMFAAKDERNGYAVLLDQYGICYVVKIENGKIKELNKNSTSGENKDGGEISIALEDWRWQFKLGGKVMYTCEPLPWMGHKAGLYDGGEASFSASRFSIEEAIPSNTCPLPFTQEQLNEQLSKVICAAPDDFMTLQGVHQSKEANLEVWRTKDVSINGTADMFIGTNGSHDKKGRDFIIMFGCTDSLSADVAFRFFDQFMKSINNVKPACGSLKQREVQEDLSDFLLKAVIWDIDVKTTGSTVRVRVELDVNQFKEGVCYNSLHVNVPN